MAVTTHGSSLPDSSQKTDFYNIIDTATVTSIVDADISSSAGIQDTKLATIATAGKVNTSALTGQIANTNLAQITTPALVSGASFTLLPNIPPGAGIIPAANIGSLLGAWEGAKSQGQIYQATTDLFVTAGIVQAGSGGAAMTLLSDGAATPTIVRDNEYTSGTTPIAVQSVVKKNDYFEVTFSGVTPTGAFVYTIPIGS